MSIRRERPNGPAPSLDDIDQWLEDNQEDRRKFPIDIVRAALDSGEEVGSKCQPPVFTSVIEALRRGQNIEFEVVKCVRYDLEIVKQLQEKAGLSEDTSCQTEGLP